MNYYSLTQWLLFFFLYCFLGWIWESSYVSVKERMWVNRGFLHGPFLPIYGSGAIVILISTINFRNNLILVFIFGLMGASILEYITGATMEKIFGVRYWDYSDKFLNINGHVCLMASLCWGFFSCIMVKFLHRPFEYFILGLPDIATDIGAFLITIYMAVDVTQSVNEAMDLKAMLNKISSEHEHIRLITEKLEIAYTFAEDEYNERKKKYRRKRREISFIASRKKLHIVRYLENKKNDLSDSVTAFKDAKLISLINIKDKAKELMKSKLVDENLLISLMDAVSKEQEELKATDEKQFRRLSKILKRNPMAVSKKNKEAMEEIKHLLKR